MELSYVGVFYQMPKVTPFLLRYVADYQWATKFILTFWDGINCRVLVSPPLKRLFKGPPPSLLGIPLRWSGGVTPINNLHHSHVCIDEFTQTGATLQYSDFRCHKIFTASRVKTWFQKNIAGLLAPKHKSESIWKGITCWCWRETAYRTHGFLDISQKKTRFIAETQDSSSAPQVLSHTSVSLARLAPLFKWSWTGILHLLGSKPLTYKKWADFSLLPAVAHSSRNNLIPSRKRVPEQAKEGK